MARLKQHIVALSLGVFALPFPTHASTLAQEPSVNVGVSADAAGATNLSPSQHPGGYTGMPASSAASSPASTENTNIPSPQTLRLEGSVLHWNDNNGVARTSTLPCPATKTLATEGSIYVVCDDTVHRFLIAGDVLQSASTWRAPGPIDDLFVRHETVWVVSRRIEAQPLEKLQSLNAIASTNTDPTATSVGTQQIPAKSKNLLTSTGKVTEVSPGQAVISLGDKHGLQLGSHVQLFELVDRAIGKDGDAMVHERELLVGEVVALSENAAQVRFGVNEIPLVGSSARLTERRLTASRLAPTRVSGVWDLRIGIRPFLALSERAAGFSNEVQARYRFEQPFSVHLELNPATIVFNRENKANVGLVGLVAYDHRLFEIGLGAGYHTRHIGGQEVWNEEVGDYAIVQSGVLPSFVVAQHLRIGSLDGLHIRATTQLQLNQDPGNPQEGTTFKFGSTFGTAQIPLSRKSWLVLQGGGGAGQVFTVEAGLRVLSIGNGEHGSLFVTPVAGATGHAGLAGPTVGAILEWRPRARTTN